MYDDNNERNVYIYYIPCDTSLHDDGIEATMAPPNRLTIVSVDDEVISTALV